MTRVVSTCMAVSWMLILFPWQQTLAQNPDESPDDGAIYRVEIENTWSPTTHPGAFPAEAHFSWLGGGVHNQSVSFWQNNELASAGMVRMAESGVTTTLAREVQNQVNEGKALSAIDIHSWFCPDLTTNPSCGELSFEIEATPEFASLTLATMLGPSPDWFVGVSSLPLRSEGQWIPEIEVELFPYDGGTRSDNVWLLGGPRNDPPEPISLVTTASGQLVGPGLLGYLRLTRILVGDFDQNGQRDAMDMDLLSDEVRLGNNDASFDLNGDDRVDQDDRTFWVEQLERTDFGDANLDGVFNSSDFVAVLAVGEYEDSVVGNSTWAGGDWNGDAEFDSSDLLFALQHGGYTDAAERVSQGDGLGRIAIVPEPSAIALLLLGGLLCLARRPDCDRVSQP